MNENIGHIAGRAFKTFIVALLRLILIVLAWLLRIVGTILIKVSQLTLKMVTK